MNASKTRHLDTAISIFKSNGLVKRGHRPVIQVAVHHDPRKNEYLVQVGSRVVAEGVGDRAAATLAGDTHAERLKNLGKKTVVIVY
jgi:hypothetical protein